MLELIKGSRGALYVCPYLSQQRRKCITDYLIATSDVAEALRLDQQRRQRSGDIELGSGNYFAGLSLSRLGLFLCRAYARPNQRGLPGTASQLRVLSQSLSDQLLSRRQVYWFCMNDPGLKSRGLVLDLARLHDVELELADKLDDFLRSCPPTKVLSWDPGLRLGEEDYAD